METIRVVNLWLRQRGVEADSKFGKPLHRLRKQFGSELATRHGIFVTQKLLGHSTPTITAKHYAALTELPTLSHVRLVG
jgi:integrase